jgi:hypothetical protein
MTNPSSLSKNIVTYVNTEMSQNAQVQTPLACTNTFAPSVRNLDILLMIVVNNANRLDITHILTSISLKKFIWSESQLLDDTLAFATTYMAPPQPPANEFCNADTFKIIHNNLHLFCIVTPIHVPVF